MAVLLGGRAAEHIVLGALSTGAADDLAKATDIARSMVMRYGMDRKLGQVTYEAQRSAFLQGPALAQERSYSEETAREIDCAIRALVDAAFERAVDLLSERRQDLERGADQLLSKETLVEDDLRAFAAGRR
jgi:cell division protease FtsH